MQINVIIIHNERSNHNRLKQLYRLNSYQTDHKVINQQRCPEWITGKSKKMQKEHKEQQTSFNKLISRQN